MIETFLDLESRYFDVASAVTKLQKVDVLPIASSTFNAINTTFSENYQHPKLSTIKLPIFDGTPDQWLTFKNKFEALVHSRTDLSNLVKHYYSCSDG